MNRRTAERLAIIRRQEAEARERVPVGAIHYETREVLAGAYAGEDYTYTLTHAMIVDSDGHELAVACSAVKLMSLADKFAHSERDGGEREPTCKTCSTKWRKWKATGEVPAFRGPKPAALPKPDKGANCYVWALRPGSSEPLSIEGPYGPYGLRKAEELAYSKATSSPFDRVVSQGIDPESPRFIIVRRYGSGSGDRLI